MQSPVAARGGVGQHACMWSGKLLSGLRAPIAAGFMLGLGGCVTGSTLPPWYTESMLDELRTQQEYADFIAARYAGMAGDPSGAAAYYRRAFGNAPTDATLLERATFATLASGDAGEAIRVAAAADPSVSGTSPTAQLALIVDDIAQNRARIALQRLKTANLGAINNDLTVFLVAWLTAAENTDKGLGVLSAMAPRRQQAGEQAAVQALILMTAARDDKAGEAFEQARRLRDGAERDARRRGAVAGAQLRRNKAIAQKIDVIQGVGAGQQARALRRAYDEAGFSPSTVELIEAHGTGTKLGDPVEVHGLRMAFSRLWEHAGAPCEERGFCGLGSVKTNIGHLEGAAGIAGVLKVLLGFQHGRIPASLNLKEVNPLIRIENTPFYFVTKTQDWPVRRDESGRAVPRVAGVSSFT